MAQKLSESAMNDGNSESETRVVSFTQMKDGTREDYLYLRDLEEAHNRGTAERLLRSLHQQADETIPGYRISRLEHSLQSATRAYRDGVGLDWVVAALLHDIGDGLAPQNHDRFAAEILRPFVREEITWTVEHHGAFQMVYYAHHYGWDRYEREKFNAHPYYQTCVDFCERWDQASFDPGYRSEPLEFFEPMLREVFQRKAYDDAVLQIGVVKGLAS